MPRKLFITPPAGAAGVVTRCVRVPASQEWLAVFNAALLQTARDWNYEQLNVTDLTPAEAAAIGYQTYVDWLTGDCSLNCDDVFSCLPVYTSDQLAAGTYNVNTVDPSDITVIETRFPAAVRGTEILPPPAGCSKDELWAGILEIVTRIDNNGRDFWQTVVAETDKIDRIAEMIALVPLFGDIVGEALSLLADIAPDMLNAYDSYSTQAQVEEIACDLFQTVCGECRYPTYQEVFDYYSGRSALGTAQWQNIAFDAIVDVLLGTSGASEGIIYMTTNILQIWVLSAAATWIQTRGVQFVALWASVGAGVPSNAWELLCGPCGGVWSHSWLGGGGQGPWVIQPADFGDHCYATYDAGNDRFVGCCPAVNSSRAITVLASLAATTTVTRITVEYAFKCLRDSPSDGMRIQAPLGSTLAERFYVGAITGTGTLDWTGSREVASIQLRNYAGNYNSGDAAYSYITRITVEGTGYDPFI